MPFVTAEIWLAILPAPFSGRPTRWHFIGGHLFVWYGMLWYGMVVICLLGMVWFVTVWYGGHLLTKEMPIVGVKVMRHKKYQIVTDKIYSQLRCQ